ncbi:MAG: VOC family protein [Rhodospirillales bacterium]|nr:VOC family protein [Rhodospirillales bacterium]MDE0380398.1 VOC family protein [Rhodospirillales bacterium]
MSLNVYLFFDGNCREAFEFYRSVFGGEFKLIQTFSDGPPELNVPDSEKGRIMHVSLPVGSTVLMGSDSTSAFGPPQVAGDNFAISVDAESREQCDDLCARLSEGGTVTTPPQEMFWGAYFGCWTDRFGIKWMVNYAETEE